MLLPQPKEVAERLTYLDALFPESVREEVRHLEARGDTVRAEQLAAEHVPATLLFEARDIAVVDGRWCGGEITSIIDWSWIGELYPCEDEEGL